MKHMSEEAGARKLTREVIVRKLVGGLKPLEYIHAFYEGGAAAFGRIDELSDIDLYVVTDKGRDDDVFAYAEKALEEVSPIELKYRTPVLPWRGVSQTYYRLEGASEFLLVDLAVLEVDAPEMFLEPRIHGNPVFYFNKRGSVKPPEWDENAFQKKLEGKRQTLPVRFAMFNVFVEKEIKRGNLVEAVEFYRGLVLAMLVEALRLRYSPYHVEFRTRYVQYDLPQDVVERLGRLYYVKNEKDLLRKCREAAAWFGELVQ